MRHRLSVAPLLAAASIAGGQSSPLPGSPLHPLYAPWKGPTALDDYIAHDDRAFSWELSATTEGPGWRAHHIRLVSQEWQDEGHVERPRWTHWLTVIVPERVERSLPILAIGGGRSSEEPRQPPGQFLSLALATGAVVAHVDNVPNQPLRFAGDERERWEDGIIARTWIHAMDSDDPTKIGRFPMVKAAVKAMDAAEAFLAGQEGLPVQDGWFVLGASKRGWTTWLTAAVDPRVRGIAPLVIDVLNLPAQLEHHHASYGFWAPALHDYVDAGVTERIGDPRLTEVFRHEDPLLYQDRIDVPVYIVNASGDQFFPTDSAGRYTELLDGDWRMRVHPNAGHSLEGTSAIAELAAFYAAVERGAERPGLEWSLERKADGAGLRVQTSAPPERVTLWSAVNEDARDFRIEETGRAWEPRELSPESPDGRTFAADITPPGRGWRAFFIECRFATAEGSPGPLVCTTRVFITPDVLPHAGELEESIRGGSEPAAGH